MLPRVVNQTTSKVVPDGDSAALYPTGAASTTGWAAKAGRPVRPVSSAIRARSIRWAMAYLTLYGWTQNPLVEYYIVDSWGSWRPPGSAGRSSARSPATAARTTSIVRSASHQPSIEGTKTFYQYWSVRQAKTRGRHHHQGNHFSAWASVGLNLGTHNYQVMGTEGYQSSGSSDITVAAAARRASGGKKSEKAVAAPRASRCARRARLAASRSRSRVNNQVVADLDADHDDDELHGVDLAERRHHRQRRLRLAIDAWPAHRGANRPTAETRRGADARAERKPATSAARPTLAPRSINWRARSSRTVRRNCKRRHAGVTDEQAQQMTFGDVADARHAGHVPVRVPVRH